MIVNVVGLVPVAVAGLVWITRLRRARRVLRFSGRAPVDIVLTTSREDTSDVGAPILRPLTGVGQVQGVTQAARAMGGYFYRKEIRSHLSVKIMNRLDSDLIVLGGPAKNQIAADYLARVAQTHQAGLRFDDITCSAQAFGVEINDFNLEEVEGLPAADVALALVDRNPFSAVRRTIVVCCGFTSFGTAAAAEFMFDDLVKRRWWDRRQLGFTWSRRHRAGFLALLRVRISGGASATLTPLITGHLDDPHPCYVDRSLLPSTASIQAVTGELTPKAG